jgi:hypothetical protein
VIVETVIQQISKLRLYEFNNKNKTILSLEGNFEKERPWLNSGGEGMTSKQLLKLIAILDEKRKNPGSQTH